MLYCCFWLHNMFQRVVGLITYVNYNTLIINCRLHHALSHRWWCYSGVYLPGPRPGVWSLKTLASSVIYEVEGR